MKNITNNKKTTLTFILIVTTLLLISLTFISKYIFNTIIIPEDYLIGYVYLFSWYLFIISFQKKETKIDDSNIIKELEKDLENCQKEKENFKDEIDYITSKYENLKSEMIVQKNIKY